MSKFFRICVFGIGLLSQDNLVTGQQSFPATCVKETILHNGVIAPTSISMSNRPEIENANYNNHVSEIQICSDGSDNVLTSMQVTLGTTKMKRLGQSDATNSRCRSLRIHNKDFLEQVRIYYQKESGGVKGIRFLTGKGHTLFNGYETTTAMD